MSDSIAFGDTVMAKLHSMSNISKENVQMSIDIYPGDSPITINKIVWEKVDTVWNTLQPVSMKLSDRSLGGQKIFWIVKFDFPYTSNFDKSDRLIVYTDKGKLPLYIHEEGKLINDIRILTDERDNLMVELDKSLSESDRNRILWIVFLATSSVLLLLSIFFIIKSRQNDRRLRNRLNDTTNRLDALTERNSELETINSELYRLRLDSINRLCEDYYEKSDSDNMRAVLYNDLKNYILSFKNKKKVEEIRDEVNSLQSDILNRITEQLPDIHIDDLTLLTYILGGFSSKAISVFLDINVKQFYYRRDKLRNQILASDAPDKEIFASKI